MNFTIQNHIFKQFLTRNLGQNGKSNGRAPKKERSGAPGGKPSSEKRERGGQPGERGGDRKPGAGGERKGPRGGPRSQRHNGNEGEAHSNRESPSFVDSTAAANNLGEKLASINLENSSGDVEANNSHDGANHVDGDEERFRNGGGGRRVNNGNRASDRGAPRDRAPRNNAGYPNKDRVRNFDRRFVNNTYYF